MDEGSPRRLATRCEVWHMTRVPYVDLVKQNSTLRPDILKAIDQVLCHGQFINGPEVAELERKLAERLGVGEVVGVASGTSALTLAMRAIGLGPGDEVITVAHSYVATATSIVLVGATPVFVDVDPATGLMDPQLLEEAISPRSKAVMPVHLGGIPCFMEPIQELCSAHGLHLIEDCAQAIGSTYRGRSVGAFGAGCFSLHPLKTFSACGDAGFITTDDRERAGPSGGSGHSGTATAIAWTWRAKTPVSTRCKPRSYWRSCLTSMTGSRLAGITRLPTKPPCGLSTSSAKSPKVPSLPSAHSSSVTATVTS